MKYNKAKWVGPCKVVSVLKGGLFELLHKVTTSLPNTTVYTHSSSSGFVENIYYS